MTPAHEALLYGTDEELLAVVVPYLRDGLAAGDAILVALNPPEERLVLGAIGDAPRVTMIGAATYASAESALDATRELIERSLFAGAAHVRLVGAFPPGYASDWQHWAQYEAAMNVVLGSLPVSALCVYDRRTVSPEIAADVEALHPFLARPYGQRERSPAFSGAT